MIHWTPIHDAAGKQIGADYSSTPYKVLTQVVEGRPGTWRTIDCQLIHRDTGYTVHSWTYMYSSESAVWNTVHPFEHQGRWYVTYSSAYTRLSVFNITDQYEAWTDEGGAGGFCPVAVAIPWKHTDVRPEHERSHNLTMWSWLPRIGDQYEGDASFRASAADFGFYSGCIWGDDSSWKLRYLDFSRLSEGIVVASDAFGYIPLPTSMTIQDCVELDYVEEDEDRKVFALAVRSFFVQQPDGTFKGDL